MKKNKAVFLDRDGTIIKEVGAVCTHKPADLEFMLGAISGLTLLSERTDYKLIVVTNQSGIGKELYTEKDFKKTMKYMHKQLKKRGIKIEKKYYYCPHHPDDKCKCRKPEKGMLEKAIQDFNIDPWKSWMIGDRGKDIDAGASVGCKTILIEDKGPKGDGSVATPDFIVKNLYIAACEILKCQKY